MLDGSDHAPGGPWQTQPSAEEIRAQLAHLVLNPDLDIPDRARKFLRYIVDETLAGRGDRIKAYSIGTEVFDRDASFDPQSDPVVRIEAGRLRRALEHYYLVEGLSDRVVIDVPKGAYLPRFSVRTGWEDAVPFPTLPIEAPAVSQALIRNHRSLACLAAVVLATLVSLTWWGVSHRAKPDPSIARAPTSPTLVIVPFANLGDGPEDRIYAEGLTEEILTQLARFKELTVLGRETSRSLASPADLTRISRDLGVRYVLEGSVRTASHQLRVAGRLIDAETGAVLWSHTYDDDLRQRDFFAIQDDVAQKVATAIGQPYGIIFQADGRRTADTPDDLEAYTCSLRFYGYRANPSAEGHEAIGACLERAVARYPKYATAWAMLSLLALDEDRFGFNRRADSQTAIEKSLDTARHAIRLDPENVRAQQALMIALFFSQQPVEALAVGEKAVALNPNDTELLADFGSRVGQVGDWQRGTELLEQALVRNPAHSDFYNANLAVHAYMMRDYERAESLIRQVNLDKLPLYHFVAAIIYAQLDKQALATGNRNRFLQMRPDFFANWDTETAKRNYRPADAAHLAEGARKAGFAMPAMTAAERTLQATALGP